jgi:hypothetical protein
MAKKECIIPPSKTDMSQASKLLRQGSGAGGHVLSDAEQAKKQGAKRPKGK